MSGTPLHKGNQAIRHKDRWCPDGDAVSLVRPTRDACLVRMSAEPKNLQLDIANSGLVIIDMQNDFLDPDGWFGKTRGLDVMPLLAPVPSINSLSAAFRGKDRPVFHLSWGVRKDVANLPASVLDKAGDCGAGPTYGDDSPHGAILAEGEWGAESITAIDVQPSDLHVSKHRLSGFRDNEFDQILRRHEVRTLFFTGINIDRCVFATLTDASFQGYDCILVTDACASVSPDYVTDAILYLTRLLYGFTTTTQDVLSAFQSQSTK